MIVKWQTRLQTNTYKPIRFVTGSTFFNTVYGTGNVEFLINKMGYCQLSLGMGQYKNLCQKCHGFTVLLLLLASNKITALCCFIT